MTEVVMPLPLPEWIHRLACSNPAHKVVPVKTEERKDLNARLIAAEQDQVAATKQLDDANQRAVKRSEDVSVVAQHAVNRLIKDQIDHADQLYKQAGDLRALADEVIARLERQRHA